jgi:hypothetical protein
MIELVLLAEELQAFFEARDWKFCFIGGLAVQQWSELRTTKDVDLTLFTGFGEERRYIDELLRHYAPRRPDAAEFAERYRVLLLQNAQGVGIDIAMGGLAFEELCIARAQPVEMRPGHFVRICTAEDLIVHKVFAARDRDWHDVEMTLVRQEDKLDWCYIREQLRPLLELKEAPELLDQLELLRERVARQP